MAPDDAVDSVVDTSNGVSVNWGELAALLVGTVFMGWLLGFVEWLNAVGSGIASALVSLSEWVRVGFISAALDVPTVAISTAWQANGAWIEANFGTAAPVIVVVQLIIIGYLLAWVMQEAFSTVMGVF